MKKCIALAALLATTACATGSGPVASDFDEDSVTIRNMDGALIGRKTLDQATIDEANRLCALSGRRAEFLGVHPSAGPDPDLTLMLGVPVHANEFEFACLASS